MSKKMLSLYSNIINLVKTKQLSRKELVQYFGPFVCLFLMYCIYVLHAWSNTETSDNAYIDCDISNVSAEVSGSVKDIFVYNNQMVKKGDIVAKVDDVIYIANAQKAQEVVRKSEIDIEVIINQVSIEELNLKTASSMLALSKSNLDLVEKDYNRNLTLAKDHFASKKNIDNAKMLLEQARSKFIELQLRVAASEKKLALLNHQLKAAYSNLDIAKQSLILSQHDLANTEIKAPIDGMFANSGLRVGNFVRPGIILFSVVPTNKFYLKVNFKETQVTKLASGMQASIAIDALPGQKFKGKIRNIYPATGSTFALIPSDNATGNFTKIVQRVPVIIDFVKQDEYLGLMSKISSGMSAVVSVRTDH